MLYLASICSAELRTWTAINGNKVEAEFVSSEKGVVKLKLKSGKVFNVPLNKLSKADQGFIKAKPSSDSLANNIVGKLMTLEVEGDIGQMQLYKDGRIMMGQNGNLEDLGVTYKIEGNEVVIFEDGERNGGISFSSSSPKVSDQIEMGPKGRKQKSTILKIEAADEILKDPLTKDKPVEGVSVAKLELRDGLAFIKGSDASYTGKTYKLYPNGKIEEALNWEDGIPSGIYIKWYVTGEKMHEGIFKNGKPHGEFSYLAEWGEELTGIDFKNGKIVMGSKKIGMQIPSSIEELIKQLGNY